jgi:cytoskeletal protein CcmA (bactofilin family)
MNNKQKQWLAWGTVALVLTLVSIFLGVKYPIPEPPFPFADETVTLGTTHFTNVEAEDITATDDLTVTDDTTIGGDITISGTASWGCTTATIENDLTLTGTLTAEDAVITDTLDVNGDIDLDGDGFDVNITAGFSIDADAASNINVAGAGIDLTIESEAGRVVIKGDEATADAIYLDANDAAGTGIDIDVGSTGGLSIDGGVTNIGGGTPDVAAGDNDLFVTGDLEVDGELELDGTIDVDGVITGQDDLEHIFFPTVASTAFTYTAAAGGTVTLWTIAAGEIWLVHDIYCNVTTDWDCTGDDVTVDIGDGSDPNGLCDLDDAELQAADTEVTGAPAGWQCFAGADTIGAYIASGRGFIYTPSGSAETIDAVIDEASGETITAGAATCYIVYTRIQ